LTGVAIATRSRASFDEVEREARLEVLERASRIVHSDSPWFALRVMTGREIMVHESLEVLGITSLVPMRKGPDLRRRGRLIEGSMQPVIYGYVLVQSDPHPEILVAFKGVDQVIDVLGGADRPMRVTTQEINRFKAMAEAGTYDWAAPSGLVVQPGDLLRVTAGPFSSLNAVAQTASTKGRGDVVVSVTVFGRETPVTMPLAMLEKL
jgi:transcriptional antiterminator NusG